MVVVIKKITFLLFFFFYTIAFTVLGQTYYSKNYNINDDSFIDNLPSNQIRSICLDSKNLLWIGTDEGLCRF